MVSNVTQLIRPLFGWQTEQWLDTPTMVLLTIILGILTITYIASIFLRRRPDSSVNPAVVDAFNVRVRAWWLMFLILTAAFLLGKAVTVSLFFLLSFWALREFITLTPTRMGDHRTLFWVFFLFAPAQYALIAWDNEKAYELHSIFIPVYAYLFIPARIALAGDSKRFLERAAKIQAALLFCVYALSYAPALLYLKDASGKEHGSGVLLFLIVIVHVGDIMQYVWSKLIGRRTIAPNINANRTWEGFFGGILTTTLIGAVLSAFITPFTAMEASFMSLVTAVMGFAGGITMSAIKRDRGVKDYGTLVVGHAGILDRLDSLCFAAPVFYHLTRLLFA
ncbi:MAG: phosphatidate cytidylyltransferase [Planctomycetales bacterium]|nr:phosphatidate cytidylyltransferase [Planctomycetales bacterium]